ncbi:MAG: hypothetical protein JXJ19_08890 [Elusimicrobia bacterium]|nr:hypothetical protein [Elusimicrobiota bacterium]
MKNLEHNTVTLEDRSGKTVWGMLRVANSGFELVYREKIKDADGHYESSYIVYKSEYPGIQALIRYHDDLTEREKKKREKDLQKTYHPNIFRRTRRKTVNIFKTVRDSLMDLMNIAVGQTRRTPLGSIAGQDKYINKLKDEYMATIGNAYEPLLERHIGKIVVLELNKGGSISEYPGILKDYTSAFIEMMDINYKTAQDASFRKADLVVPRDIGIIRHLAE